MKVNAQELARAAKLAGAVANISSLPILTGMRLQAEGGVLKLTCTDLDTTVSVFVEDHDHTDTDLVVPAKLLVDAIGSKHPADALISLEVDGGQDEPERHLKAVGGERLTVTGPAGVHTLRLLHLDDWPNALHLFGKRMPCVDADTIGGIIKHVLAPALTDNDARPVLTGVWVELHGKELAAASTDSYRMHAYSVKLYRTYNRMAALIPATAFKRVGKALTALKTSDAALHVKADKHGCGSVTFVVGPASSDPQPGVMLLTTRLIEGEFPKYRSLIPDHTGDGEMAANWVEIPDALALAKRLRTIPKPYVANRNPVLLVLADEPYLEARAQDLGEHKLPLPGVVVHRNGKADVVAYDPGYLADMLEAAGSKPVVLSFRDGVKPALLRGTELGDPFKRGHGCSCRSGLAASTRPQARSPVRWLVSSPTADNERSHPNPTGWCSATNAARSASTRTPVRCTRLRLG